MYLARVKQLFKKKCLKTFIIKLLMTVNGNLDYLFFNQDNLIILLILIPCIR